MPENYNLTPEQGKIWQIQKAWDGTDICNVGGILRLSGKEDADILARAVGIYVQTQSAFWLRMNRHGKQYFEQIFSYEPEIYDCRKSDREEMASVVQQWMCEPFHIYDEHLFEFRILCLRDENVVYGKFHHLIADSYAISLVVKVIEKIYEDLEKGIETFKTDRRFLEKVERMDTACKENKTEKEEQNVPDEKQKVFPDKRAQIPDAGILAGWLTEKKQDNIAEIVKIAAEKRISWYHKRFDYKELNAFCRKRRISVESLLYAALTIGLCRLKNCNTLSIGRNLINRGAEERNVIGMYVDTKSILLEPDFTVQAGQYAAQIKKELALQAAGKRKDYGKFDLVVSYRPVRYLPSPKKWFLYGIYGRLGGSSAETVFK